jgi:8-oxo-dGTP diphosphatase
MTKPRFKKDHVITSVVAVILNSDGEVLLTKRNIPPFQGEWVMPGGKINLGEPISIALQREVMEEVGLEVAVEDMVGVFEHVTPGDDNYHFIILYYRCRPLSCSISHNRDEVAEARWVPGQELQNYPMPDGTRFILGKIFSFQRRHDDGLTL